MYLLEGAGELHGNYNMSVGDVMVFAQNPTDQSLIIAGRPATKVQQSTNLEEHVVAPIFLHAALVSDKILIGHTAYPCPTSAVGHVQEASRKACLHASAAASQP